MTVLNLQVAADADELLQVEGTTSLAIDESSISVGTGDATASPDKHWFWRFTSVTVPQGADIVSASVSLRKETTQWQTVYWTWRGNAIDNASNPTRLDTLTMTTASTVVSDNVNRTDTTWYSWDVATIVQEIVDRAGWASGNALALLAVGDGGSSYQQVLFSTYDDGASYAAKLDIEYTGGVSPLSVIVGPGVQDKYGVRVV